MTPSDKPSVGTSVRTTAFQSLLLAVMRIAIGWHFLYEGVVKLLEANWTATGYLQASTGPLAGVFRWMATEPTIMKVVDQLNIWGLILVGACLMLGLLTRFAALGGMGLLALYYAANPPLFQTGVPGVVEGHYLLVNKNLVELFALAVVLVLPANHLGLDGLLFGWRRKKTIVSNTSSAPAAEPGVPGVFSRRQLVTSLIGVPVVGGFALAVLKRHGWLSHEEKNLADKKLDGQSGATLKLDFSASLKDLKGTLPQGEIGKLKLSRMILGGNLMGGWAHARDLIYVSKLVKAYHHRTKIFETFSLAEACGVNTILTNPLLCDVINDYWRTTGGKIQFISDCGGKNVLEMIQKSIDAGASACYIQGGVADQLVSEGKFDLIAQSLELIRKNGLPAGIGGHKLGTIKACRDKGFKPDFWMKTLHHRKYWSATGEEENEGIKHDNFWCWNPEEVIDYMKQVPEPWIAFKILGAGAIHPRDGFRFAFEGGADFICVGMYDFQLIEDVNIALDVLNAKLKREREWMA